MSVFLNLEFMLLSLIILLLSLVQSIFGVGLLLFGTPTLLLLGYSYDVTLWILLPASMLISLSQVIGNNDLIVTEKKLYVATLPPLVLGLFLVVTNENFIDITKVVGAALILIGLLRISKRLEKILKIFLSKNTILFYFFLGGIHGISNMGGGPLTVLMSSLHATKESIRANIAQIYFLFAFFQLLVLSITRLESFNPPYLMLSLVAIISYFFLGKKLALLLSNEKYQYFISLLILCYGIFSFL